MAPPSGTNAWGHAVLHPTSDRLKGTGTAVESLHGVQPEPCCGPIRRRRSQRARREGLQERERTGRQRARDLRHTLAAGLDKAAELAGGIRRAPVARQAGLAIGLVQWHEDATKDLNRGIDIDTAADTSRTRRGDSSEFGSISTAPVAAIVIFPPAPALALARS